MANASKPSILNDRRAIGSENELDEYGVWLKSESEEFAALEQDGSGEDYFPPFEEKRGPAADAYEEHTSAAVSSEKTAISGAPLSEATLSAALLLKIAGEIALIKKELAALKAELDRRQNERETPAVPVFSVPRPAADNPPAGAEVAKDEAAGTDTIKEKTAAETAVAKQPVAEEPAADSDAIETGTDFFGMDKSDDKITLTSGELNLLAKDAGESVEEMGDSFFADERDEEKIAVSGDEINDILGSLEIPAETASNKGVKVEEIAFEDIPDEPVTESGPADTATDSLEEDMFDIAHIEIEEDRTGTSSVPADAVTDLSIEPEGKSVPDGPADAEPEMEINFAEDAFDIDVISFDREEGIPETPVEPDGGATDLDEDAEEDGLAVAEPETADIAFDPFGSLPDEDALDRPDTGMAGTAAEDAPFAGFSVLEDSSAGTDDAVANEAADTTDTAYTIEGDSSEPDIANAETDPVLSRLVDEDFHQTVPAPEDTAYLDDEKPLELDETAEPEASDSSETSGSSPDGKPEAPRDDTALEGVPLKFKEELRAVLSYMEILLESLPDEKIEEFARSEHFEPYKKLFKELGLA
jgi:hypothetical protein